MPSSSTFSVKIWGARGSLPSPMMPFELERHLYSVCEAVVLRKVKTVEELRQFFDQLKRHEKGGFGGNTPCVELNSPKQQIIIDGGSGIRPLGYEMMNRSAGQGKAEIHLFLTHFHWDHLIGLPFFTPIFIHGNRVHVYAVQEELPEVFRSVFRKPYFPVPLESLGARIEYHRLTPRKPVKVGDFSVTPYQLDHPDPCWGFRVENAGKIYSHCVDTECTRVSREDLGKDLPLYQNADLMVFDAQYTLLEALEKVNWGHAAASLGLEIAMREKIKQVLFMHHDPASDMGKIAAAEAQAKNYYESRLKRPESSHEPFQPVQWSFAYDGQEIMI